MLRKKAALRPRSSLKKIKVRKGQGSVALTREEFFSRFRGRFFDPLFQSVDRQIDEIAEIAWKNYSDSRKAPRTVRAGKGFADPDYQLSVEWLESHRRIKRAERRQRNSRGPSRILLICGSSRSDQTCPGEMSKTFRLVKVAERIFHSQGGLETDLLDLSRLTSEYGRVIYPCKACVSTSMALCHWPCSCYPNNALGQVNDWMSEIYERWVAAHGIMIVTPVHWYQAPSVLKLMIDRLVCADGGNPDPTSTHGKNPKLAKALELKGWPYPRHLKGRAFSVIVHGDAAGVDALRRSLCDWLTDMELIQAGESAVLGRYIGYYEPYATSHDFLDGDRDVMTETRNAALSLVQAVKLMRKGEWPVPDRGLVPPRPK
jgi:multimeric flavodoxin WrbA